MLNTLWTFILTSMGILPNREFYQGYIGGQLDLTPVMTLNKKSEAQLLSSTRQAELFVDVNCEL